MNGLPHSPITAPVVIPSPSPSLYNSTVPTISQNDTVAETDDNSEADDTIEVDGSTQSTVIKNNSSSTSTPSTILLITVPLVAFAVAFATRSFSKIKNTFGIEIDSTHKLIAPKDVEFNFPENKEFEDRLLRDRANFHKSKRKNQSNLLTTKKGLAMMIHVTPGKHMLISEIQN